MDIDLKADLDKFLRDNLEPINKKMLDQEKIKHERFIENHFTKYDSLGEKHDSYVSQLMNLEGVIFGAIVVFTNSHQVSIWLATSVCLILISLIFGIWRQKMSVQSSYDSHEWNYRHEMEHNLFVRKIWNDSTVELEKEMILPHLEAQEENIKKRFEYKLLKFLNLKFDDIEFAFIYTFVLALGLLIPHMIFRSPLF